VRTFDKRLLMIVRIAIARRQSRSLDEIFYISRTKRPVIESDLKDV